MVDEGKPEFRSREEGKHTGRNDLLHVEKMMWMDELIRRLQSKKKTRVNTDMVGVVRVEFSVIFTLFYWNCTGLFLVFSYFRHYSRHNE